MSRIVLYGAGGFALEILEYLVDDTNVRHEVIGYISDVEPSDTSAKIAIPFLGVAAQFYFDSDVEILIAVGTPSVREKMFRVAKENNAKLFTLVHPQAMISPSAVIGEGSLICPFAIVNAQAVIGENVAVNVHCSIGHGASVGNHSVLSPYTSLSGDSQLGSRCFTGTRGTLFPKVSVGDDCTIDAHSYVRQNVPNGHIVSCRSEYLVLRNRLIRTQTKG